MARTRLERGSDLLIQKPVVAEKVQPTKNTRADHTAEQQTSGKRRRKMYAHEKMKSSQADIEQSSKYSLDGGYGPRLAEVCVILKSEVRASLSISGYD